MLFSDKLEKIYQDIANEEAADYAKLFMDALEEELRSSIGRGPQYDIKAHE